MRSPGMLGPFHRPEAAPPEDEEARKLKQQLAMLAELESSGVDISKIAADGTVAAPAEAAPVNDMSLTQAVAETPTMPARRVAVDIPADAAHWGDNAVMSDKDAAKMDREREGMKFFEAAGRQLVAGLTNTQVAPTLLQSSNERGIAQGQRDKFRMQALQELERGDKLALEDRTFGAKRAEMERASAEAKRKADLDQRDFDYRKTNDQLNREQRDRHSKATLALAGRTLENKENNEGRLAPAVIEKLGGFETAKAELDDLMGDFEAKGMDDKSTYLTSKIPNTKASQYGEKALATMQSVGYNLEGGKLQKSDEEKYERLMPKRGDSQETARAKIATLKNMLDRKRATLEGDLQRSGYKVNTGGPSPGTSVKLKDKASGETHTISPEKLRAMMEADDFDQEFEVIK